MKSLIALIAILLVAALFIPVEDPTVEVYETDQGSFLGATTFAPEGLEIGFLQEREALDYAEKQGFKIVRMKITSEGESNMRSYVATVARQRW